MKCILILLFFLTFSNIKAQQPYNSKLLDTLQNISNTPSISKHFAKLYFKAIEITNTYATTQPEYIKQFIFGFEDQFGPLFFKAHYNNDSSFSIPKNWEAYYKNTTLNELQYQFIGMNAHINGDMWKALVSKYSYDTLSKYKKPLLDFQGTFNNFFDSIYSITKKYKKVRTLHFATFGLDKVIGRRMVYRWRKNQVTLALLSFKQPKKFKRKLNRLEKKINRINKYALKYLK